MDEMGRGQQWNNGVRQKDDGGQPACIIYFEYLLVNIKTG